MTFSKMDYKVATAGGPTDFVGWVLKAQDASPFAYHEY